MAANPPAIPPQSKRRRPRLSRIIALGVLIVMLTAVVYLWMYYAATRRPIAQALPLTSGVVRGMQPHYLFSIYGVDSPVGVAATPRGDRVYVTESEGERLIKVFDRDGKLLASFAPPDSQSASRSPAYVALDKTGRVFVTDVIRHTVDSYDGGGNFKSSLKPPTDEGWAPLGLRWSNSDLLVTDLTDGLHRVLGVDLRGNQTLSIGREGRGDGEFWFPNAVIIDQKGRLYVSDSNNARLQIFSQDGTLLSTLPGFSLPRGMALDDEQRLYVVDTIGQTVRVFDASKDKVEILYNFGDLGTGNGEFNFPNDVAADAVGRIYIADRANDRVQVWTY